jgi:hypothetical protein
VSCMHVVRAGRLQNFGMMNKEAAHIWVGVSGQHKLDAIYRVSQAIFNVYNYGHEFGAGYGSVERGARGLRLRRRGFW